MADNNALRYSDSDNEVLSTYLKAIDKIPLLRKSMTWPSRQRMGTRRPGKD